jgi:DNA invertase Pin-like site-specific DNA recombinase
MDTITTKLVAAFYGRFSSDMQRDSSITDQLRNCQRRAAQEGWDIRYEFADKAISGTDSRRPQYIAMQAAAARGDFSVLLLDDLSRLARDSVEQEQVIRRLEFQRVRIVAVSDGYDSAQKGRKIQRGMKGLMNELFIDDLREKVHRGMSGQALAKRWCGSRPYGYKLKALRDPSRLDAYGEQAKIGTVLEVDEGKACIVREIFTLNADGQSPGAIAALLNARGVRSPGSYWTGRKGLEVEHGRRCSGWLASGVRVILANAIYKGRYVWNARQFIKDEVPDMTRKQIKNKGEYKICRKRPPSEWLVSQIDEWRIVTDELWQRVHNRTKKLRSDDKRRKNGGTAKYLLSGLLRCEVCGAHYVIQNARGYGCSSHWYGKACRNGILVRRDSLESIILAPVTEGLLDPKRVAKIAREGESEFARRMQEREQRATALPRELQELDERLARLRNRLRDGDPDMAPDEIQLAIAEAKRRDLAASQPEVKARAKLFALIPKAAALYRQQIKDGLLGNTPAALQARVILRDLVGPVTLAPEKDGSLWASYRLNPQALVRGVGTVGSGGRI